MAKLNDMFTADSLQNYQNAYNDYMKQGMNSNDALAKAKGLLVEKSATPAQTSTPVSTPVSTPTSNSGPADGYATATERNMATNGAEFGTGNRSTVTETPKVKEETAVKTDTKVKQGALTPLDPEYYQQTSQEAQDKIISNLNNYKQTNPEYFSDYDTFKRNFNYDGRNDIQKQTLDTWYGGYQKGLQLSSLPVTDLYTQYKDGRISPNDLESLRISNPTKYAELQNTINRGNIIQAYDDDKGQDTTGMSMQDMAYKMMQQTFMQFMNGDNTSGASQYFREYEDKMNDPEMLALSDQTTEIQENMENLQTDIDFIKKTVEKEYEGTGASRAKINAIISDRTYDLQLQLRTLNSEYNKYATQYNNRMQQYQTEFSMQLQEYQINMQERNQKMNELGFAMDLMSFETPQQKQDRERDYWVKQQEYQNGNINSKDYQTRYKAALNSVQNLLSQYEGIPMVRSAEQMADDILKAIDTGSNLGAELTKINQQIQQKPEYKQLYNQTYGTGSSNTGFGKTIKIGDMELIEYNGQWLTADQVKAMFTNGGGSAKPYDMVDASKLNNDLRGGTGANMGKFILKKQDGMTGGQCGKYVNDYLEYIGMTGASNRYYDNELSTKLNSINTYDPKEGTIAVFDYNHKSSDGINHGHVGIVTKVTQDGIYVKDSNYSGDEKVKTRFIKKGSSEWEDNLKGFFDPSQPPMGSSITVNESLTTTTLSPEDEALKKTALAELTYGMLTPTKISEYGETAAKQGWNDEWIAALNQNRGVNMTQDQANKSISLNNNFAGRDSVKDYKEAVTQLEKLIVSANADNGVGDMAAVFTFMKTLDPSSVVREGEFNSAAKTAGVLNPGALWQKVERLTDGEILTPSQRKDFIKVAKEYVKSHSKSYELEYKDLQNQYKAQGIPEDALPINRISYVDDLIDGLENGDSATSSSQSLNNLSATALNFSKVASIANSNLNQLSKKNAANTEQTLKAKYGLVR